MIMQIPAVICDYVGPVAGIMFHIRTVQLFHTPAEHQTSEASLQSAAIFRRDFSAEILRPVYFNRTVVILLFLHTVLRSPDLLRLFVIYAPYVTRMMMMR